MAKYCTQCGTQIEESGKFCVECGTPVEQSAAVGQSVLSGKRERVLGSNKSKSNVSLFIAVIIVPLALGILIFFENLPALSNPIIDEQPLVAESVTYPPVPRQMKTIETRVRENKIILPLDVVLQKKFVAFEFNNNGRVIPLLAYVSGEGKVITAISMCEPCNSTRFHIKGEQLVCNSCGTTWELNSLDGLSGACQGYPPDAIPSIVVGNEIQIEIAPVINWKPRV